MQEEFIESRAIEQNQVINQQQPIIAQTSQRVQQKLQEQVEIAQTIDDFILYLKRSIIHDLAVPQEQGKLPKFQLNRDKAEQLCGRIVGNIANYRDVNFNTQGLIDTNPTIQGMIKKAFSDKNFVGQSKVIAGLKQKIYKYSSSIREYETNIRNRLTILQQRYNTGFRETTIPIGPGDLMLKQSKKNKTFYFRKPVLDGNKPFQPYILLTDKSYRKYYNNQDPPTQLIQSIKSNLMHLAQNRAQNLYKKKAKGGRKTKVPQNILYNKNIIDMARRQAQDPQNPDPDFIPIQYDKNTAIQTATQRVKPLQDIDAVKQRQVQKKTQKLARLNQQAGLQ